METPPHHNLRKHRSAVRLRYWLNSPFAITLVGGMIGTLFTVVWQYNEAKAARIDANRTARAQIAHAEFERNFQSAQQIRMEFTNDFPAALERASEYRLASIGLRSAADIKSYNEELPAYLKARDNWLSKIPVQAFPVEIESEYSEANITHLTNDLDLTLARLYGATKLEQVEAAIAQCDTLYDQIVKETGANLRLRKEPLPNED